MSLLDQSLAWLGLVSVEEPTLPLSVVDVHTRYGAFVFACLQRFGIHGAELLDAHQEVFLVVFRRLDSYDHSCCMTAWLFGIARRVAAAHHRRAHRKWEVAVDPDWEVEDINVDVEEHISRRQTRQLVERLLNSLDLERRAVLVMHEIEGMECTEIGALLGIPVGTVYSRLHAARRDFEAAVKRHEAREKRGKLP